MAKMLANWEHALERLLERIAADQRSRVQARIDKVLGLNAPAEAVGHYQWHIDVSDDKNQVIGRLICRGITLRTVYSPTMNPPAGSRRYKIKDNQLVPAGEG